MATKAPLLDRTERSIVSTAVGLWLDNVAAESRPSELAMTKATVLRMFEKLGIDIPDYLGASRAGPPRPRG